MPNFISLHLSVAFSAIVLATSMIDCHSIVCAEPAWPHSVQRTTDDRDLDVVEALLQRQRFDEADAICRQALKSSDPQSDLAAKWAIRYSNCLTERQMAQETFPPAAVVTAQKPVADLLASHPDHRRRLFLKAHQAAVEKAGARHAVIVASVSPQSKSLLDVVFKRLARVTTLLRELADEVDAGRTALSADPSDVASAALRSDLTRLYQELQIDVVSMALLQTDLFQPGSHDYMASASKAERAADQSIKELPVTSQARLEVERLRVQAILRGGDLPRAERALQELRLAVGQPAPPRVIALLTQMKLAQGNMQQASQVLNSFYGSNPDQAPRNVEMDLVRLDFLIRSGDRSVGQWLEQIEARNGAYARRRAEAISLGKLRASGESSSSVSPAIVAAQGQDWLRRDQPARAGQLLAAAAQAERDPSRAIRYATESAAAWMKAKQPAQAANVLYQTAVDNSDASDAANAHLQGSVMLATANTADAANRIEAELTITCQRWPSSDAARQANKWHVQLLSKQKRTLDAAKAAAAFLIHDPSPARITSALELWIDAVVQSDEANSRNLIEQFQSAFAPLLSEPKIANAFHQSASYIVEPESLAAFSLPADSLPFTLAFYDFRKTQTESPVLKSPPESLLIAAHWRLMRDAKNNPNVRKSVAALIQSWPGDSVDDRALLKVWSDDVPGAISLISDAAKTSTKPGSHWRKLADSLASLGTSEGRREAIKIWDRLASGLPKNSQRWHEAKLSAIELLAENGQVDEATKRAKYILLTSPPQGENLRRRYETVSQG